MFVGGRVAAVLEDLWHPLEHVNGRAWPSLGQVKHLPGVQQTLEPEGGCAAAGGDYAAERSDGALFSYMRRVCSCSSIVVNLQDVSS